jgi:hypothetical protein
VESDDVEYWPTPDPTLVASNREQMLDAYRDVRDGLMRRIRERFGIAREQDRVKLGALSRHCEERQRRRIQIRCPVLDCFAFGSQ